MLTTTEFVKLSAVHRPASVRIKVVPHLTEFVAISPRCYTGNTYV